MMTASQVVEVLDALPSQIKSCHGPFKEEFGRAVHFEIGLGLASRIDLIQVVKDAFSDGGSSCRVAVGEAPEPLKKGLNY